MNLMPLTLLALAAALSAPVVHAQTAIYVLDPEHSFVHFEVLHFGTSTLRGRFGPASGHVELDRSAQRGWAGVTVRTDSVDTGMAFFDARLRQADLLAVEAGPTATFIASKFRFEGDRVVGLVGELTLRGISQGLELRALRFGCHTHPVLQREVCGGDFEGELRRGDFGASFGMPFVANQVRLKVQVEGLRQ
jgi:polyisoprenoid-binding protein YceI